MSLKQKIQDEFLLARKTKNTVAKNILSVILGDIQNFESTKSPMTDEQIEAKIRKVVDSIKETISLKTDSGRNFHRVMDEDVKILSDEVSVLSNFLPSYLTENQIIEYPLHNKDLLEQICLSEKEGQAIGILNKYLKGKGQKVLGESVKNVVLSLRKNNISKVLSS